MLITFFPFGSRHDSAQSQISRLQIAGHLISMVGTSRSGDSRVTKGGIVFLCLGYNRNTISVTAFLCSKIVILCWTQKATLKVLTKDKKKCTHLQQHCIYQGGSLWAKVVPILRTMCQLRSFNILQCEWLLVFLLRGHEFISEDTFSLPNGPFSYVLYHFLPPWYVLNCLLVGVYCW